MSVSNTFQTRNDLNKIRYSVEFVFSLRLDFCESDSLTASCSLMVLALFANKGRDNFSNKLVRLGVLLFG